MILCIGDMIQDYWTFGTATRICPEAPVPVVVPDSYNITAGGVGLVASQLQEFGAEVYTWEGSMSKKTRIFAGSHLICRIDEDSQSNFEPEPFPDDILRSCECVVVSDYAKGAIFPEIAEEIVKSDKPLFVDAKKSWSMYDAPFVYWFPNELEYPDAIQAASESSFVYPNNLIEKRGRNGAKWGDISVEATVSDVVDTTGAGDIFLAAFVYANMILRLTPTDCLQYANILAGESCKHRGTYVIPKAYAQSVLYSLQPSLALTPPVPFAAYDSSGEEDLIQPALFEKLLASGLKEFYSRIPDSHEAQVAAAKIYYSHESEQTPRIETLSPIEFADESIRACESHAIPIDYVSKEELATRYPSGNERHNEHKPAQDQVENPAQSKPQV